MCRAVQCRQCRKTTWAGCGQHVPQVMADVPRVERCSCGRNAPKAPKTGGGFFARLLGR